MTTEAGRPVTADHDWDDYYYWPASEQEAYVEYLQSLARQMKGLGDERAEGFLLDLARKSERSKYAPFWSDAQKRWLATIEKKVKMLKTPEGRALLQQQKKLQDQREKAQQEAAKAKAKQQDEEAEKQVGEIVRKQFPRLRANGWDPTGSPKVRGGQYLTEASYFFARNDGDTSGTMEVHVESRSGDGTVTIMTSMRAAYSAWNPHEKGEQTYVPMGYAKDAHFKVYRGGLDDAAKALDKLLDELLDTEIPKAEEFFLKRFLEQAKRWVAALERAGAEVPREAASCLALLGRGVLPPQDDMIKLFDAALVTVGGMAHKLASGTSPTANVFLRFLNR